MTADRASAATRSSAVGSAHDELVANFIVQPAVRLMIAVAAKGGRQIG